MNKKLIKIITCITCGLGITSPILFVNTSCSCSCSSKTTEPSALIYDSDAKENLKNRTIEQFNESFTTELDLSDHVNFDVSGFDPKEYDLKFSIEGTLPAGLTINSDTGIISGKPTNVESSTFKVKATCNFKGKEISVISNNLTYTISAVPTSLSFDSTAQASFFNRTIFQLDEFTTELDLSDHVNFDVSGFDPKDCELTFSIIEGTLPAGLIINSSTGIISGAPTNTGIFTFKIKASCTFNGKEIFDTSNNITYNINAIPSKIVYDDTALNSFVDKSYQSNQTITNTLDLSTHVKFDVDGFDPRDYGLTFTRIGSLPPGLNFNESTGVISGTIGSVPTTITYSFRIKASCTFEGSNMTIESKQISYTISPAPVIRGLVCTKSGDDLVTYGSINNEFVVTTNLIDSIETTDGVSVNKNDNNLQFNINTSEVVLSDQKFNSDSGQISGYSGTEPKTENLEVDFSAVYNGETLDGSTTITLEVKDCTLPLDVYSITTDDETKTCVLNGFKDDFNPDDYDYCTEMMIPKEVTIIGKNAFNPNAEGVLGIPEYIKKIYFESGTKCVTFDQYCFANNTDPRFEFYLPDFSSSEITSTRLEFRSAFNNCKSLLKLNCYQYFSWNFNANFSDATRNFDLDSTFAGTSNLNYITFINYTKLVGISYAMYDHGFYHAGVDCGYINLLNYDGSASTEDIFNNLKSILSKWDSKILDNWKWSDSW